MKWDVVKLGEVADFLDNKRRPLNNIERETKRGQETYPYFGANGMVDRIDEYIFDEPICCVAEDGGYWGAKEKCSYLVNEKCWVNNHAHVVRPKDSLQLPFLSYFLNYSDLSSYVTGTTRGKLTKGALERIEIPLPPLAEQKRIASILDRADHVRRLRVQTLERLDELVAALFLESFGDPATNPKGWPMVKLGEMASLVSSGSTPLGGNSTYLSEGILFIRSQNVLMNAFDFSDVAFIAESVHQKMKRTWVQRDDVLLNITGASIGRTHVYNGVEAANVNQHVCIIRPIQQKLSPFFLSYHFASKWFQSTKVAQNNGATRQAFNFQQIKDFDIPLPPLSFQQQFAARVSAIESIKVRAREALVESEALFASLQYRAFEGEL